MSTIAEPARLSPPCIRNSPFAICNSRLRAFTLLELMVSVAILAGIMTMVGVIFSTASKAGGQATASSTLQRHMRQVAETVRRDLRGMTLDNRMMAIAGVQILAKDNASDVDTDPSPSVDSSKYWHRSDVFMLMTDRPMDPYISGTPTGGLGTTHQVIYGHANTGKLAYTPSNGWDIIPASVKLVESGEQPASQWHLTRRILHFPAAPWTSRKGVPLTDADYVEGRQDLYAHPYGLYDKINPTIGVYGPRRQIRSGYYEYLQNRNGAYIPQRVYINYEDDVAVNTLDRNNQVYRMDIDSLGNASSLLDGGYWWALKTGVWSRTDQRVDPPNVVHGLPQPLNPPTLSDFQHLGHYVLPTNLFYGGPGTRTVIDPNPPVEATNSLAAAFLPGCSEFQVEYTYDNPREVLVDSKATVLTGYGNATFAAQPIRWESVPAGEVRVWSRLSTDPSQYGPESTGNPNRLNMTFPYRWPRALRISIRVWDPGNRLTEPMTRTIIHVFDS